QSRGPSRMKRARPSLYSAQMGGLSSIQAEFHRLPPHSMHHKPFSMISISGTTENGEDPT
ncbi:hypothetical protein TorRG33x02_077720, partial [Trema orientale]